MIFFFFLICSHFYVVSMCLMRHLHLARYCASAPDNSLSDKSFLMLSNHLRFGLPLFIFPGPSIPNHSLAYVFVFSSQCMPMLAGTCPPTHAHIHACTYTRTHAHTYTQARTHTRTRTHTLYNLGGNSCFIHHAR